MPELPEVETIRKGLERSIIGQIIADVTVILPKMFIGAAWRIRGREVISASRRGKLLIVGLSGGDSLLVHLKMTGQLVLGSLIRDFVLPDKSTKVIIDFVSGDRLFFNDYRTFGYMQLFQTEQLGEHPFLKRVGIEPFDAGFTLEYFRTLIGKSSRMNIKGFLLDQTKVAGLGNIYTDEVLFLAGILPTRLAGSLTDLEIEKLYRLIPSILAKGIELGGSSRTSYITLSGDKGTFLQQATVYQRNGLICHKCGSEIQKIKLVGRGTHFCPICQS